MSSIWKFQNMRFLVHRIIDHRVDIVSSRLLARPPTLKLTRCHVICLFSSHCFIHDVCMHSISLGSFINLITSRVTRPFFDLPISLSPRSIVFGFGRGMLLLSICGVLSICSDVTYPFFSLHPWYAQYKFIRLLSSLTARWTCRTVYHPYFGKACEWTNMANAHFHFENIFSFISRFIDRNWKQMPDV